MMIQRITDGTLSMLAEEYGKEQTLIVIIHLGRSGMSMEASIERPDGTNILTAALPNTRNWNTKQKEAFLRNKGITTWINNKGTNINTNDKENPHSLPCSEGTSYGDSTEGQNSE